MCNYPLFEVQPATSINELYQHPQISSTYIVKQNSIQKQVKQIFKKIGINEKN